MSRSLKEKVELPSDLNPFLFKNLQQSNKPDKIFQGMACNTMKHIFFIFRTYMDMFIDWIFGFFWEDQKQSIPDLDKKHSILIESAVSLAAKIKNKELKSEDLVRACIERIQAVNPILNAVTDERFQEALKEAAEVDQLILSGLPDDYFQKKPFLGVPFTAKESHAVCGMFHTLGIKARAHIRAHEDAECVRLLRAAGAIPLAVTNVPEINKWHETRNMLFGQTNNPYHTGRTSGGSSGGEAALTAAMATPIALCSDIGGSTRLPAFYCGLFALNPTAGHTSMKGSALRSGLEPTMASIGFLSRHCSDLIPLTKIVAAEKAADLNLDRIVDLKKIKYYYVESSQDLRVSPISQDLREAMNKVVTKLTEEASSSDLVPKPFYHEGLNHMASLWRYWMSREAESFPQQLAYNQREVRGLVELPKKLLGLSDYTIAAILKLLDEQVMPRTNAEWAESVTKQLKEELVRVLGSDGVLLFPSAPAPAPHHYALLTRPYNFAYCGLLNALHFPAAQVPLGLNGSGLPLGVQVAAAPRHDALCVAVAQHLGDLFGGYSPPCALH